MRSADAFCVFPKWKSKKAKLVGDWAELIVMQHLREAHPDATESTHRAIVGETPGWDIDFVDPAGRLRRVEVKGTVGGGFTGVEFTAGELQAARTHGSDYWLYLVAECLTSAPRIQAIQDPADHLAEGIWTATPVLFQLRFGTKATTAA